MFVCTLRPDEPLEYSSIQGNGEFIIRVPVGFETETGVVYSVFVAFSPLVGYADIPGYECIFTIIEAQPDGSHDRVFWDGTDTIALICDREHRALILGVICGAVSCLIDESGVNLISMVTHSANLPPNALSKFGQICRVFAEKGFISGSADPWHGRHIWMMQRPGELALA